MCLVSSSTIFISVHLQSQQQQHFHFNFFKRQDKYFNLQQRSLQRRKSYLTITSWISSINCYFFSIDEFVIIEWFEGCLIIAGQNIKTALTAQK